MSRPLDPAMALCDRIVRPHKIGILGHRGVGKTTLLTMLYHEAVAGRLPGVRLAAGDDLTARYLADKIHQLEAGEALPATLDQMELRFHLYQEGSRIELLFLDYQGEHVELGRAESIRDFLRDCDAVWLCVDARVLENSRARWQTEQEIEQTVEDYLATEQMGMPARPMALVVTKSDLLDVVGNVARLQALVDQLGLTRHALATHAPWRGIFAVSSLGATGDSSAGMAIPLDPQPAGLDAPLVWLGHSLREQDLARLERLSQVGSTTVFARAARAHVRAHPDDVDGKRLLRLASARLWRRRGVQALGCLAAALALVLAGWWYDARGATQLEESLASSETPMEQLQVWRGHQFWYPTRYLFRSGSIERERADIAQLDRQARLVELRRMANDPRADLDQASADLRQLLAEFPEDPPEEVRHVTEDLERAIQQRRDRRGREALLTLDGAGKDLPKLVSLSTQLAREHQNSASGPELRQRAEEYRRRLEERAWEEARDYSTRNPLNFFTRRQRYQAYLDHYPAGMYSSQARAEILRTGAEWDRHDYRAVRDAYTKAPEDLTSLRSLARSYLTAHPTGDHVKSLKELLRWCDQVAEENEYKVTLKSGSFSKQAAATLSRGINLSVEIEVAGVKYGPSTIAPRGYQPEWDYEFPRKVRWKLGDPVRVIVTDHYFWRRKVGDILFDSDQLAMRKLTGEVELRLGSLVFQSDFRMPTLPPVE